LIDKGQACKSLAVLLTLFFFLLETEPRVNLASAPIKTALGENPFEPSPLERCRNPDSVVLIAQD
jgi:hypothetical protein